MNKVVLIKTSTKKCTK